MPVKCTFCKTAAGQVTLGKRALKCYKAKNPNCSADDLFCNKCNNIMEEVVARTVAKQKKRKLLERQRRTSIRGQSSTSSSSGTISLDTIIEKIATRPPPALRNTTPNTSGARRPTSRQQDEMLTSPEIQYTQSQSQPTPRRDPLFASIQDSSQSDVSGNQQVQPVRHEYIEDVSDDEQPACPIAGPSTSAAVTQPIVRKRKTAVVFADERIIPIYNRRRDFGG